MRRSTCCSGPKREPFLSVTVSPKATHALVGAFGKIRPVEEPRIPLEPAEGVAGHPQRETGLVGNDIGDAAAGALLGHLSAAPIVHDHASRFGPNARVEVDLAAGENNPDALSSGVLRKNERPVAACQEYPVSTAAEIAGAPRFLGARTSPLGHRGRRKCKQDHVSPPTAETLGRHLPRNGGLSQRGDHPNVGMWKAPLSLASTDPSGQRCVTTLFLVQKRMPSWPYWPMSPKPERFHPPKLW